MSEVKINRIPAFFGGEEYEIHSIAYDANDTGVDFVASFAVHKSGQLVGNDGDLYPYDRAISFLDDLASYENPILSWKEIFSNAPFAHPCVMVALFVAEYYELRFNEDCKELKGLIKGMAKANLEKGGDL